MNKRDIWLIVTPKRNDDDQEERQRGKAIRDIRRATRRHYSAEEKIRIVLDGMLGSAGFDVQHDILAITVNRWPHGYAYEYLDLWDPVWPRGRAPHEIARKPMGNITIANADAGASAYTHVAIDEAYRAVRELPS